MDNELLLFDRLEVIKTADEKYDLEKNGYLSFSGGKDSTILHHLLDIALPNNRIPRVFIDTGMEYAMVKAFVMKMAEKDDRFKIIKPSVAIKPMLEKEGYPFKSKLHSKNISTFQRLGMTKTVTDYLGKTGNNTKFRCPKSLEFQFTAENHLKIANICCQRLKKDPVKKYEAESGRSIAITGMRKQEGGTRANSGCVLTDKNGKVKRFNPLLIVDDGWENWLIKENDIQICGLYHPPFNFKRTGCKGCPFSLDLQEQLTLMETYLPKERRQCEIIWRPVYAEYRRLHYRLTDEEQLKLF